MVLSLPDTLQEPAFMLIQYSYAVSTMLPCPIWFWYRYASATFLMSIFCWSVYNGATYYIDVFGKRLQNEMEALKKEVAKWQNSPDMAQSPLMAPKVDGSSELGAVAESDTDAEGGAGHSRTRSVDQIPLLNSESGATGLDGGAKDVAKGRKVGELPS